MNENFSVATLDENKLNDLKKLEAELSLAFGREIVLIAWEKRS
ncbi:MAG: hypothetical protein ACRCST_14360 [Turicibacter sp.]